MKLFALVVLYKPESGEPVILKGGYDLSSFSFFQRTSVQEFIKFTSKIISKENKDDSKRQTRKYDIRMNRTSVSNYEKALTFSLTAVKLYFKNNHNLIRNDNKILV